MSSQMSSNHLSAETSLKDPAYSDPYLSAPLDADEADFRSSAIRLTPVPDDIPSQFDLGHSPCPSVHPDNSSVSVFSPEELLSSSSLHDSPGADGGVPNPSLNISMAEFDNWQTSSVYSHETHGKPAVQLTSPQPMFPSAQVFSPLLSDDAGPPSDLVDPSLFTGSEALLSPDNLQNQNGLMPHLMNSSISDGLSMKVEPESRARSPIVMVESVSRGDSPVNAFRRPSAAFLAPGGESSSDDADFDDAQSSISRAEDGSWVRDTTTGQAGVDPTARDDIWVPSPNEMESNRQVVDKHTDIHNWTASVSAATNDTADDQFLNLRGLERPKNRRRAKSAGDPSLQQDLFALRSQYDSLSVPGPGLLLQVKTDEGFSELESGLGSDSPTSMFHTGDEMDSDGPSFHDTNSPQPEEPLPSQFVRSKAVHHNSSAAMMEYQKRSKDLDRASIIANWGTRDMGEAEFNRIARGDTLENLTIDETEKTKEPERRSSFMGLLPRAASPLKRPRSAVNLSSGDDNNSQDQAGLQRKTSTSSNRRKFSLGRSPRSRNLSTGNAMAAMAGTMAAIGTGDRLAAPGATPSTRPTWHRGRSKSEVPLPASPGLANLMGGFGGPPAPVSNFGFQNPPPQVVEPAAIRREPALDDDDDEEEGMVMEFPVQTRLPVPTLEGFKQQIRELNPRLEPSLLDRFANEQVRRYKDLVDHKMAHANRVSNKACTSHHFCFQQGGDAAQAHAPELNAVQTQFHIPGHKSDEYSQNLAEGAVSAAQFPPGVPMPPVQRLPAEFECSICFKVRKFQKPSDWTKHVHEDVQPFTCTFPECTEPKSFKRKADWVRHESERHRQLEWWTCSFLDCQHTCYRKDNFVQHLVREHKMPEPKAKKSSKSKGRPTPEEVQREHDVAQLWKVVDSCRHETSKNPREEPCRFCGNVCNGWKKLTVHLAKHMEQIALPVLGLVQERNPGPVHAHSTPAAVSSTKNMPPPSMDASAAAFTYPPPSLTNAAAGAPAPMQDTQFFSAEPESMNPYEEMASQQFLHPQVEHDQLLQQPSPLHHSSVTYPPPASFGAVSRSRTPELHDIHHPNGHHQHQMNMDGLFSAPEFMEPIYDQQGSMYMSPTTEYSDPMAMATTTSLSYDSGAAHLQGQYL